MARSFDDNDDHLAAPQQSAPVRKTHSCKAHGCPLAGSAFDGLCSNHWEAHTHDWQRVTQVLRQMRTLITEVNRARRTLCDPDCIPDEALKGHIAAQERIKHDLSAEQLAAFKAKPPSDYRGWAYMLENMITTEVQRAMKKRRTKDDVDHPANKEHRIRQAQIPGQAADFVAQEFQS